VIKVVGLGGLGFVAFQACWGPGLQLSSPSRSRFGAEPWLTGCRNIYPVALACYLCLHLDPSFELLCNANLVLSHVGGIVHADASYTSNSRQCMAGAHDSECGLKGKHRGVGAQLEILSAAQSLFLMFGRGTFFSTSPRILYSDD